MRRCLAAIAVCIVWPASAFAASLGKEECDKLQAEQTELTAAGARAQFDRGPEWGKANLPPDQLQRVQRFIAVEEQLSFRCGLAKLRVTLPQAEEGGEQELDEKGNPVPPKATSSGDATAKAAPKAKQPVKAKEAKALDGAAAASTVAKPKPKAKPAAEKKAGDAETKPTAAKTAPKPRPKVDDAYRPPPSNNPSGDPFAGQKAAPPKQ